MNKHIEAIYEDGVLKPLEPIDLKERQKVSILILWTSAKPLQEFSEEYHKQLKARQVQVGDNVSLEEVRDALSSIPGSLSEEVIAQRKGH